MSNEICKNPIGSVSFKYSKSSEFYTDAKRRFFDCNSDYIDNSRKQNQAYNAQIARTNCKICETKLSVDFDLRQHGVEYKICTSCGHLNGVHDDTEVFFEELYTSNSGADYAKNYIDSEYTQRTLNVYKPKVEFLISTVGAVQEIIDVGCGGGYFVYAALLADINARGIDVSETMVNFGNSQISKLGFGAPLKACNEDDFFYELQNTSASVVSAVGVIEHLRSPQRFFEAFRKSKSKYIYYSVPMLSLSVYLENGFPDVFPRQLSGAHTHLFTEASLKKMNEIMKVKSVAEWRFGTDIMDLYRSLYVSLDRSNSSETAKQYLRDNFVSEIDSLQHILDKSHFCSEINLIAKKIEMV